MSNRDGKTSRFVVRDLKEKLRHSEPYYLSDDVGCLDKSWNGSGMEKTGHTVTSATLGSYFYDVRDKVAITNHWCPVQVHCTWQ